MPAPAHFRRRWLLTPLSLALLAPAAQGAAFLPGSEADPPTGDVQLAPTTPAEPLRGDGIQWTLAPWRYRGTLGLDLRAQRLEDGRSARQSTLMGDLELASYIWQPWFVQLRLGVGFVASQSGGDAQTVGGTGATLTGRVAVSVFPASRFPFEFRADQSDSRSGGESLSGDYRSRRVSLSQGWRPETGTDNVQLQAEHSELTDAFTRDRLSTFNATVLHQAGEHTLDAAFNHSDNQRSDSGERTLLTGLNARHSFHPAGTLSVETLASWNELRAQGLNLDSGSDVRQLSSFASWRGPGSLWSGAGAPLVAATARWVQVRGLGGSAGGELQAVNVSLGASQELGPVWRASVSGTANHLQTGAAGDVNSAGLQAGLTWAPATALLGGWRYAPTAGLNAGAVRDSSQPLRQTLGLQGSHGVTRDLPWSDTSGLSLSLTQSAAVLKESEHPELARALAHGASLGWQSLGSDGSQSYGGLSYSDSRTDGVARGHFQLLNLQLSQRMPLSRYAHWSANLTLQGSNNRSSELDVFSGLLRDQGTGWQRFYTGSLSYEHQRAFGVPRLRHTVLLSASSQPLERRALGDIDAPRERISESLESRLDYAIGQLDTRLSARVARVEGRTVVVVQARAQRRF